MAVVREDIKDELLKDFKEACGSMGGNFKVGLTNKAICSVEGDEGDAIEILFSPDDLSLSVVRTYGKMMTRIHIDGINSITSKYPELGMKIESENGSTIDIDHKKINAIINTSH